MPEIDPQEFIRSRRGQPIVLSKPEPRYWGIWSGTGWMLHLDGTLLYYPLPGLAIATAMSMGAGTQAREIGPDGMPMEESE